MSYSVTGAELGTRPTALELTLLADTVDVSAEHTPTWDVLSNPDVWSYTYTNLPRYRTDNVTPIEYSVRETPVAGYSPLLPVTAYGTADASAPGLSLSDPPRSLEWHLCKNELALCPGRRAARLPGSSWRHSPAWPRQAPMLVGAQNRSPFAVRLSASCIQNPRYGPMLARVAEV